jgi:outer membrane murein-binding lipoprotein Lpp
MRIFKLIMPLAILLICGCTSDVERISKEIDTKFDNQLSSDLRSVVSTMNFYLYAVPENYWYPEGTTNKEIIEDEFKQGYQNLGKLDDVISQIQTNNSDIQISVDTLHNRIIKARTDIKKARKALEQANSIFGFGLFGGASTLYDFANLLGSNTQDVDEGDQMPKEVKEEFTALVETIFITIHEFLNKTHEFETNVIGSKKITDKEMIAVRSYLQKTIKDRVKLYSADPDTIARNEYTFRLINSYDELFPLVTITSLGEE